MGGGGGKTPEPTKFTPPPINDAPPKNPIPNFFANRPVGPSPYQAMGQFTPQATQGAFGGQVSPQAFTPPQMQQPTPQPSSLIEALAPVIAEAAKEPEKPLTQYEKHRLGKGQR